jgi:HEAT repeat protein
MPTGVLPKNSLFLFLASWLLFPQQQSMNPPVEQQTTPPAQQQPAGSNQTAPGNQRPNQQPATPEQRSGPGEKSTSKPLRTPKEQAWQLLHRACTGEKTSARATAVGVLGLLPENTQAREMAEKALADEKPEVRSSAAAALGAMHAKAAIGKLREAANDQDPSVALAAAHALIELNDDSGYEVYYEVLTGERKGQKGLIASQTAVLKDPKKMAELGIQEGLGFVPFAGMGWQAFKVIRKGDPSPVRAAAAKVLAKDPDPATTKALADAAGDKNWVVRAAALEALARRGDPSVLDTVEPYMSDDKDAVKYTAAAAVLRLSAMKPPGTPVKSKRKTRRRRLGRQKPKE